MASSYAEDIGAMFLETSAKDDLNVQDIFVQLSELPLLETHPCFLFSSFAGMKLPAPAQQDSNIIRGSSAAMRRQPPPKSSICC